MSLSGGFFDCAQNDIFVTTLKKNILKKSCKVTLENLLQ